jgi:NADH-quinone oxidoreductase subunit L
VISGYLTFAPLLFGGFFDGAIVVAPEHAVVAALGEHFHEHFHGDPLSFALHGFLTAPFWLVVAGAVSAWYIYLKRPELAEVLRQRFAGIHTVLINKYGFDEFYQGFFAGGSRRLGQNLWKYADAGLIDGVLVNGTAHLVGWVAGVVRHVQSGYLYHYAFAMILGLLALLTWFVAL